MEKKLVFALALGNIQNRYSVIDSSATDSNIHSFLVAYTR